MSRLDSDDALASLDSQDWPDLAIKACRLAVQASRVDDSEANAALRAVERRDLDQSQAASMRDVADQLDQQAWASGDPSDYDVLFRQARAVSALAFALSGVPDEAIYEAAHAVDSSEDLVRRLGR